MRAALGLRPDYNDATEDVAVACSCFSFRRLAGTKSAWQKTAKAASTVERERCSLPAAASYAEGLQEGISFPATKQAALARSKALNAYPSLEDSAVGDEGVLQGPGRRSEPVHGRDSSYGSYGWTSIDAEPGKQHHLTDLSIPHNRLSFEWSDSAETAVEDSVIEASMTACISRSVHQMPMDLIFQSALYQSSALDSPGPDPLSRDSGSCSSGKCETSETYSDLGYPVYGNIFNASWLSDARESLRQQQVHGFGTFQSDGIFDTPLVKMLLAEHSLRLCKQV